jgi:hypothetical protein
MNLIHIVVLHKLKAFANRVLHVIKKLLAHEVWTIKQSQEVKRNKKIKLGLILHNTIKIIKKNRFNINIKKLYIS